MVDKRKMYKEINSFLILFITIYLNTKAVSSSYSYDACTTKGSISSLIWLQNGNEHESGKEAILKCNFFILLFPSLFILNFLINKLHKHQVNLELTTKSRTHNPHSTLLWLGEEMSFEQESISHIFFLFIGYKKSWSIQALRFFSLGSYNLKYSNSHGCKSCSLKIIK